MRLGRTRQNSGRVQEGLSLEPMTLREVRGVPRIPSDFETRHVYRLERSEGGQSLTWKLHPEELYRRVKKQYDGGAVDEWIASYLEDRREQDLRFVAARRGADVEGLLTWCMSTWNDTMWLLDIRVRSRARRTGVGSALISYLKGVASQERVRGIFLETQTNNFPAVQFYLGKGFELAGVNDRLYSNRDIDNQEVALYLFWERS